MRKWKKLVGMAAAAAIFVCGCGAGETAATSAETAGMTAEDAASDSTSQEVSDKDTEQDTQGSSEAAGGDNVIRVGSIFPKSSFAHNSTSFLITLI